jgi:Bacterial extracellular solute-binding proteins, family 5 Middle/Binding-protein-dependent transport system inner membrane component
VTIEGRLSRYGSDIMNRRAWEEQASYLDWARKPVTTGSYKVVELKPDVSLTLEAHDAYWGGRPPLKRIRFIEVPEGASRINGLFSGEYQFACDIPPDQIAGIEKNAAFEVQGGTILNHRLTVFDKNHPQLANPPVRRALLLVGLMGLFGWERYARISRGLAISAGAQGYAAAVRQLGATPQRINLRHILPNIASTLIASMTLVFPEVILLKSGLSFLGLGVQPPLTSLGNMVGYGREYLTRAPWIMLAPASTIVLTTLAVSVIGDWLRDQLDPTLS